MVFKFLRFKRRNIDAEESDTSANGLPKGEMTSSTTPKIIPLQNEGKRNPFRRSKTVIEIGGEGSRAVNIVLNAPFTLGFVATCLIVRILSVVDVSGNFAHWFASPFVYNKAQLFTFEFYWRLVSHCVGHSGWDHFSGNMMLYLLVTPMLEEKYHSMFLLKMSIATSVLTALVNCTFTNQVVLGASGLVFQNIVLSAFTNVKEREIPFTLILTCLFHMSGEIKSLVFGTGGHVSNMSHLLGGLFGGIFGFFFASKHNHLDKPMEEKASE